MILLDLFCGRWGWSRAFARRGWRCIGVDLTKPPEIPERCEWIEQNILRFWVESEVIHYNDAQGFTHHIWADAIVASPPCEEFSVHGMKHFHPHPKYPAHGIGLFEHTRALCEASGLPYVIENVRAAQQFVGRSTCNAGPFYLWHNFGSFPLRFGKAFGLPRGIKKGFQTGGSIIQKLKCVDRQALTDYRRQNDGSWSSSKSAKRKEWTAKVATIPPELANCVAEFMERILEKQEVLA